MLKPMLALSTDKLRKPGEDPAGIPAAMRLPVAVQPKIDGIRVTIQGGKALTRTLKLVQNAEIQAALGRPEFEGLDGEILVGDARAEDAYRRTSSYVMASSKTGEPWTFWVFDKIDHPGTFTERLQQVNAESETWPDSRVQQVHTDFASDAETLTLMETVCVEEGYEGIIARNPDARYKHGRSGKSIQELVKVKRFVDFEAEVIGVYEEQHNGNVATTNALGRSERSTAKAGKVGKGTLGGLYLRGLNEPFEGVEFKCGTGFSAAERADFWVMWHGQDDNDHAMFTGDVVKVKSFPVGVKEKPRHPVFLGFRDMEYDG